MATATATATRHKMYIDGKWCDADTGRTIDVINPATEDVVAPMAYGGRAEARRAVEAAAKAMTSWMKQSSWERAKVLKRTAELMRERCDAIARTLTLDRPLFEGDALLLQVPSGVLDHAGPDEAEVGVPGPHRVGGPRVRRRPRPVHVQLLVAEAVGIAPVGKLDQFRAEHVRVETV